ncbi:MAG TPA: hypothetical protein VE085_15535 [Burkholderiales bacterium]|nr:hypothetical protein [Burkholderiales bacterium]
MANVRAMTPPLAKQSLGIPLGDKTGVYKDVRLDAKGAQTVLALRSKYAGCSLGDAAKYIDPSYRDKAL